MNKKSDTRTSKLLQVDRNSDQMPDFHRVAFVITGLSADMVTRIASSVLIVPLP